MRQYRYLDVVASLLIALWGWGLVTGTWSEMWAGPKPASTGSAAGRPVVRAERSMGDDAAYTSVETSGSETENENAPLIVN